MVLDTHWLVNAAYHINANHRFEGLFTSHEFPQFIKDLPYAYDGNAALGDLIAETAMIDTKKKAAGEVSNGLSVNWLRR